MLSGSPSEEKPTESVSVGVPERSAGYVYTFAPSGGLYEFANLSLAPFTSAIEPYWASLEIGWALPIAAGYTKASIVESTARYFVESSLRYWTALAYSAAFTAAPISRNSRKYGPYSFLREGKFAAWAVTASFAHRISHMFRTPFTLGIWTSTICAPSWRRASTAASMAADCSG